jgi:hypothetical protein
LPFAICHLPRFPILRKIMSSERSQSLTRSYSAGQPVQSSV